MPRPLSFSGLREALIEKGREKRKETEGRPPKEKLLLQITADSYTDPDTPPPPVTFIDHEAKIFSMYLAGYTNKEISEEIKLSEDSIEDQIKTIRNFTSLEKIGKNLANFQDSEFETPIIQEGQERGEIATRDDGFKFGTCTQTEQVPKTLTDLGITRKE